MGGPSTGLRVRSGEGGRRALLLVTKTRVAKTREADHHHRPGRRLGNGRRYAHVVDAHLKEKLIVRLREANLIGSRGQRERLEIGYPRVGIAGEAVRSGPVERRDDVGWSCGEGIRAARQDVDFGVLIWANRKIAVRGGRVDNTGLVIGEEVKAHIDGSRAG